MRVDTLPANVEAFTIRIDPAGNEGNGRLVMEWGAVRWSVLVEGR
jgi:hypothetical protein